MADAQSILSVGLPTLAALIGILVNNSRFNDFNSRLSELRQTRDLLRAEFLRVK